MQNSRICARLDVSNMSLIESIWSPRKKSRVVQTPLHFLLNKARCVGKDWAHQTSHLLLSCCHNVALNKCKSQHSWITLWSNYAVSRKQGHITIPELVKKLAVPPEKRTNYDCGLIADALYVFISSIDPFKEGLCVLWRFYTHSFTSSSFVALPFCAPAPPIFCIEFAQDLWSQMRLQ